MFSSTVKFAASFAIALSIALPAQATSIYPGSGMPTDRCAYNASPQRIYAPPAVAAARDAIKKLQTKIDRVEDKIKDIEKEPCIKDCKRAVDKAIKLVDSPQVVSAYIDHLSCSDQYTNCYSSVSYYNKWAKAYGLELIYDNNTYSRPNRAIASDSPRLVPEINSKEACESYSGKKWQNGGCYACASGFFDGSGCGVNEPETTTDKRPSDTRVVPRPENNSGDSGGLNCGSMGKVDVGGKCCREGQYTDGVSCIDSAVTEPIPVEPTPSYPPQDSQCQRPDAGRLNEFAQPDCAIDSNICVEASQKRGFTGEDLKNCRYCLKVTSNRENGRYSHCLAQIADLETELAELEDEMEGLQDALEDAEDDDTEAEVCIDCLEDKRGFIERYGPTLAHLGLAYFGVRQAKNQYEEIWEDNNAKGFTSDPRGGYSLASMGIGAGLGVMNTALSTGAFGCAFGGSYGQGGMAGQYPGGLVPGQGGAGVFAQIGGALGLPAGMLGQVNPGYNAGGGIYAGGGAGPWGQYPGVGGAIGGGMNFPGSVFGPGGGVGGAYGGGANGGIDYGAQAAALQQQAAQLQAYQAQMEARQTAYNDLAVLQARYQSDASSILSGLGAVGSLNGGGVGAGGVYGGGAYGGGGSVYGNGQFGVTFGVGAGIGGPQVPLRPYGGDPANPYGNQPPAQPTNGGLPAGIPSNGGGPAQGLNL